MERTETGAGELGEMEQVSPCKVRGQVRRGVLEEVAAGYFSAWSCATGRLVYPGDADGGMLCGASSLGGVCDSVAGWSAPVGVSVAVVFFDVY